MAAVVSRAINAAIYFIAAQLFYFMAHETTP